MEQLDDALGRLLNDPGAMAQFMNLAQSLGAGLSETSAEAPEGRAPTADLSQMLAAIGTDERQASLFRALGAYLSPKRREKLEKAMQLTRLLGLIKAAMQQSDQDTGG